MQSARVRAALGVASLLVVAVFVAFLPALSADFQEGWDDNYTVTKNGYFRGLDFEHLSWMFTTFRLGHWQPLSWVTLALDYSIWELDAFGYHLTNLILHAANAVFFYHLARAVLRAAGSASAERVGPALLAALLFALHPLRVESVVWITERRDVLSTFFLLPALLCWLRWIERRAPSAYLLALLLFGLSLLSKAWGITLPVVLLALDAWPLRRLGWRTLGVRLVEKIPFALLATGAAAAAFLAQRDSGAMHYAEHFDFAQKAAQACFGLSFYLVKSVWPMELLPAYLLDKNLDPTAPVFLASYAGVAAGVAAAILLRRRFPELASGLVVYAIVISPVLGLTQSGVQLVADRYTYLATMPFAILAGAAVGRIAAPDLRKVAGLVSVAAVALLAYLTYDYSKVWKNSLVLWTYALEIDPNHSLAWNQLGTAHKERGDDRKALEFYENAIKANPNSHLAFENRGIMRMALGDEPGAIADWRRAVELNEHCAIPISNLGSLSFSNKDYGRAKAHFERALRVKDDQPVIWFNLGSANVKLRDYPAARKALDTCLDLAAPGTPVYEQALKLLAELPR